MPDLRLTSQQDQDRSGELGYGAMLGLERQPIVAANYPGSLIAGIMTIGNLNPSANWIETSHLQSKNRYKSYREGLREPGGFQAVVNFNPSRIASHRRYVGNASNQVGLLEGIYATGNASRYTCRIMAPDPGFDLWVATGGLQNFAHNGYQSEQIVQATVDFKITGRPLNTTPKVWRISGYTTAAAGAFTIPGTSIIPVDDAVSIIVNGARLTPVLSALTMTSAAVAAEATGTFLSAAGASSGIGDFSTTASTTPIRIRLHCPGEYETWLDGSTGNFGNVTAAPEGVATAAESKAFADRMHALGGPDFFVCLYGDDEL